MSKISIIAAMSKNRVIGTKNKLPWNIPDELKRFRQITEGHPIIMGRKTHESIGRVLPNRLNIIITRDENYIRKNNLAHYQTRYKVDGVIIVHSLEEAIKTAKNIYPSAAPAFGVAAPQDDKSEIFIIGGGEIYRQALPLADKLYLTVINKKYEGDTFFPDYSEFKKVIKEEKKQTDGGVSYTLFELEK